MSSLWRAWYVFLALAFLTFFLSAFVGQVPFALSSAVAPPAQLFFRFGASLRGTAVSLVDRRALRQDNALLRERAEQLANEKRALELELARLQEQLELRERFAVMTRLSAPVTGISPSPVLRRLTLGRGASDGVQLNMPVATTAGLVGLVIAVGERYSSVRAITDPDSAVGVTVRGRGGQGVAVGLPGGLLRVLNFDAEDALQLGDIVETSSRGGLFPRGLTVGTVIELPPPSPNSLRLEFVVQPAVELSTLMEVVLLGPL